MVVPVLVSNSLHLFLLFHKLRKLDMNGGSHGGTKAVSSYYSEFRAMPSPRCSSLIFVIFGGTTAQIKYSGGPTKQLILVALRI